MVSDEWSNFLERVRSNIEDLKGFVGLQEELRLWASYKGQTLTRTGTTVVFSFTQSFSQVSPVRGMIYYRKALELQAFLDMAGDDAIQKRSADQRAQDILKLMAVYPSLRVAYIDEVEEASKDRTKKIQKVYYSALVKAALPKSSGSLEPGQNLDPVIYKIKLPGPAILGEGKPENQYHAIIIFTRGEGLQTIDMNQDNYMEEALKMRNLLQEFLKKHGGCVSTMGILMSSTDYFTSAEGVCVSKASKGREETWLFASFLFNLSGFEWQKIVDDWTDWNKWIRNRGGISVPPEKSWESWWEEEQEHLCHSGVRGIIAEILLSLRFFIYQYGLVYHLTITKRTKSFLSFMAGDLFLLSVMKTISVGRRRFSANFQLVFRLFKGMIFMTFVSVLVILIALPHMMVQDIIVCILAFMPTGWGLLLIAQALKPVVHRAGFWGSIMTLARCYEIVMGLLLFTPVAFLAWFPFVSEFQTRMLFNQAFSRGLQISVSLVGTGRTDHLFTRTNFIIVALDNDSCIQTFHFILRSFLLLRENGKFSVFRVSFECCICYEFGLSRTCADVFWDYDRAVRGDDEPASYDDE
ncbi:Callose synthase 3-like protein [Drosera capensis]